MNPKFLSVLIVLVFSSVMLFAQEPEPFAENAKWGYKDARGNVVITPGYLSATDFEDGVAAVKFLNGKIGGIDITGKVVFELKDAYRGISQFYGGYAAAFTDKKDIYN